jgi:hypothetical protein
MNLFRLAGDMTHLASCLVLLLKIVATKSCRGVSLKTQELYLLVFCARYLDLFTSFISLLSVLRSPRRCFVSGGFFCGGGRARGLEPARAGSTADLLRARSAHAPPASPPAPKKNQPTNPPPPQTKTTATTR